MQIIFDQNNGGKQYVLSVKETKQAIGALDRSLIDRIRQVRFGCNAKTIQEARLVTRGSRFDIRFNFFLSKNKSQMLNSSSRYLKYIRTLGGVPLPKEKLVEWSLQNAQRYCLFLLFHELAHIIYSEEKTGGRIVGSSSATEEKWCDDYALEATIRLADRIL